MKRFSLQKTIHTFFSFLFALALLAGCGENGTTPTSITSDAVQQEIESFINTLSSKTTFLLTDAPSDDYESVVVDVKSPLVVTIDGKPVSIPLPEDIIQVDLLELDAIADHLVAADLPKGKLEAIKLSLANPKLTDLDGTVTDITGDFTIDVPINPSVDIVPGDTIEIDVEVDKSISVDLKTGKPTFMPRGIVKRLDPNKPEDEREVKRVIGKIVEIPIRGHEKSFLLEHRGRKHFIPVDASIAAIFKGDEKASTTFEALAKGQHVGVSGTWHHTGDHKGFIKARHVVILPEEHRGMRGVVRGLERTDRGLFFELVFMHDRDRDIAATTTATSTDAAPLSDVATTTDMAISDELISTSTATSMLRATTTVKIISVKVHVMDDTKILLDGPHDQVKELSPEDLTNGQRVTVHGKKDPEQRLIHAGAIVIHPENFRAWVMGNEGCPTHIRVAKPFSELRRLDLAGVKVGPHNSGIVEITKMTKIIGLDDKELKCENLERGMAVGIRGLMIPPGDDIVRVRAFMIHRLPVEYGRVEGTVQRVAEDGKSFVLEVARGTAADATLTCDAPTVDCRMLEVLVTDMTRKNVEINQALVGKTVYVGGFFHKVRETGKVVLHALAVKCVNCATITDATFGEIL